MKSSWEILRMKGRGDQDGTSVRRFITLAALLLLIMMVALPALGQEEPVEVAGEINAVVTVGFLALLVQYLVEWLRGRFGGLDGDLIRAISIAIGYGAAWAWQLDVAAEYGFEGMPVALSYIATALVIAGGAGIIASAKNALRSNDPLSSLH